MTESLQRAFEAASELPEAEQDAIAKWLIAELNSEKNWADLFANSQDQLAALAKEAIDEHGRGETRDLETI